MNEPLRDTLTDIADSVVPTADMYERSLRHSRRIGRRRTAIGAGAAMTVLGILGAGLWQITPGPSRQQNVPVAAASHDLSAIAGTLFYQQQTDTTQVVRVTPGAAPVKILATSYANLAVSPDGRRFAAVTDDGDVRVGTTADGAATTVYSGAMPSGYGPTWSPDGRRLLIAHRSGGTAQPGVLDVGSGAFTPLPAGLGGRHFRWSGDGRKLLYGVSPCRLAVADAAAATGRVVPAIGDASAVRNPSMVGACDPVSVDATGERAAIVVAGLTDPGDLDQLTADAVVDTATGAVLRLPVHGSITAALFRTDGTLLVRTKQANGTMTLTLLSPAFTVLVEGTEPAAVADMDLVAFTA